MSTRQASSIGEEDHADVVDNDGATVASPVPCVDQPDPSVHQSHDVSDSHETSPVPCGNEQDHSVHQSHGVSDSQETSPVPCGNEQDPSVHQSHGVSALWR